MSSSPNPAPAYSTRRALLAALVQLRRNYVSRTVPSPHSGICFNATAIIVDNMARRKERARFWPDAELKRLFRKFGLNVEYPVIVPSAPLGGQGLYDYTADMWYVVHPEADMANAHAVEYRYQRVLLLNRLIDDLSFALAREGYRKLDEALSDLSMEDLR